jgi:hypothetical protein
MGRGMDFTAHVAFTADRLIGTDTIIIGTDL